MKKNIALLFVVLMVLCIKVPSYAHLALPHIEQITTQPTGLEFLIVNYENSQDITYLFTQSSQVLGYFEDIDGGEPFFLMLTNPNQQKAIVDKGYKVKQLDTNTTLSNYMLLYNHEVDQSQKLAPYVQVIPLSPHYTLIKIEDEKPFNPHEIPDAVAFGPVPFLEGISPPPKLDPTATLTPTPVDQINQPFYANGLLLAGVGAIFVIVFLLVCLVFMFLGKRKKKNLPQAPPTIPPQKPLGSNITDQQL